LCDWFEDEILGWFFRDLFKIQEVSESNHCVIPGDAYYSTNIRTFDINDVPLNHLLIELIGSAVFEAELYFTRKEKNQFRKEFQEDQQEIGCLRIKSFVALLG